MSNYKELFYNDVVINKHSKEFGKILERIDYSSFENFVFHASAYYLAYGAIWQLLSSYPINTSATSSTNPNLIEKYESFIASNDAYTEYLISQFPNKIVITDHDGTTGSYTNIRRDTTNQLIIQTDIDYVTDYLEDAKDFDAKNLFKAQDLIPQHLLLIDENDVLKRLMHVIGFGFDKTRLSAIQLSKQLHTNYTDYNKFGKGSEADVAKLLGFNLIDGQFERTLAQYLLRDNAGSSLKSVTENIWNRILNNLPYIYKTKGTRESIKAILNCYGISDNLLRINEFSYANAPVQQLVNVDSATSTEYVVGEFYDNDKVKIGTKSEKIVNINKLGLSFNPIDEIDKDIINTISPINVGSLVSFPDIYYYANKKYPFLQAVAESYFAGKSYDLDTFIRFVEDFDKGIFRTIKQIIPARTKLTNEGIVIKSHMLERDRFTDGKLFGYVDLTKSAIFDTEPNLDFSLHKNEVTVITSPAPEFSYNKKSALIDTSPTPEFSFASISALIQSNVSRNQYDYDENVVSTSEIENLQLNNFTNNATPNEHSYKYENKYYLETKVLSYKMGADLDTRIVGSVTNTTLTASSATSNCVVKYTISGRPMEFTKLRIVLPVSSQGDRLLKLTKDPAWTDYFQSLDCSDSGISANPKIAIFEMYTDTNGEIKLVLENNYIRTGNVPIYFTDENNIKQSRLELTLSGNQESGTYQSLDVGQ